VGVNDRDDIRTKKKRGGTNPGERTGLKHTARERSRRFFQRRPVTYPSFSKHALGYISEIQNRGKRHTVPSAIASGGNDETPPSILANWENQVRNQCFNNQDALKKPVVGVWSAGPKEDGGERHKGFSRCNSISRETVG